MYFHTKKFFVLQILSFFTFFFWFQQLILFPGNYWVIIQYSQCLYNKYMYYIYFPEQVNQKKISQKTSNSKTDNLPYLLKSQQVCGGTWMILTRDPALMFLMMSGN